MDMVSVSSSAVEAIGWESDVMYVQYRGGKLYAFHGVSFDTYENIKDSASVGQELRRMGMQGVLV